MIRHSYTHDWELLAKTDPLFAVLSDPLYQRANLSPEAERRFWHTGEAYVQYISDLFRTHFGEPCRPSRALDFGCGVGRILVPLARISGEAVGIDASPTMLELARAACDRAALRNVSFAQSPMPGESFDLVNSTLVFQHIPVRVGLPILATLLQQLSPNGFLSLHLLFERPRSRPAYRIVRWLRSTLEPLHLITNRLRGSAPSAPYMQMNPYPLNKVLTLLSRNGIREVYLVMRSRHGSEIALLLGRKSKNAVPAEAA
jgi:SAM-dependent methyltransferase